MKIELYEPGKHFELVNGWYRGWKKAPLPDWWYPDVGWIVEDTIAAFLYTTNSKVAFLENVVSNPDSKHEDRQAGLDLIDQAINEFCQKNGIKAVQGKTAVPTVAEAASRNGWAVTPAKYAILAKLIGDNK